MKVPSRFKQYGFTVNVLRKVVDITENRDRVGFASYRLNEIHITPRSESMPLTDEQEQHAFCHELTHFLFYGADLRDGKGWLHQNEDAVDRVARLLHQALTTMEYD